MALTRGDEKARTARIERLLEALRLNTEDLHELARQALDRARKAVHAARTIRDDSGRKRERRRKGR